MVPRKVAVTVELFTQLKVAQIKEMLKETFPAQVKQIAILVVSPKNK